VVEIRKKFEAEEGGHATSLRDSGLRRCGSAAVQWIAATRCPLQACGGGGETEWGVYRKRTLAAGRGGDGEVMMLVEWLWRDGQ
jgi:hypothetical protein